MESEKSGQLTASDLTPKSLFQTIMQPIKAGLVVCMGDGFSGIVGAGMMGRLRVTSMPPHSSQHYQEYSMHTSDIRVLCSHYRGSLLLSADSSGCWMLHALVAPLAIDAVTSSSSITAGTR